MAGLVLITLMATISPPTQESELQVESDNRKAVPVVDSNKTRVMGFITQDAAIQLQLQCSGLVWFDAIVDKQLQEFRFEVEDASGNILFYAFSASFTHRLPRDSLSSPCASLSEAFLFYLLIWARSFLPCLMIPCMFCLGWRGLLQRFSAAAVFHSEFQISSMLMTTCKVLFSSTRSLWCFYAICSTGHRRPVECWCSTCQISGTFDLRLL